MKKLLPYIVILVALVGLFGMPDMASAAPCRYDTSVNPPRLLEDPITTGCSIVLNPQYQYPTPGAGVAGTCTALNGTTTITSDVNCPPPNSWRSNAYTPPAQESEFARTMHAIACVSLTDFDVGGCIAKAFYYLFYVPIAFFLWIAGYFFNVMLNVSLKGDLFQHPFVLEAWKIIRDLSNIFFIVILLYVAFETILGLGGGGHGGGPKKVVAQVIVMALLINFSMFFTKVVIDTSNILALVFYNKISINPKVGGPRPYTPITGTDKDVAGGMVSSFDPTSRLNNPDFWKKAKQQEVNGKIVELPNVPVGTMISLTLFAGIIMGFAAYALIVSGLAFLGRLVELWVILIFSPFAFMSSALPLFRHNVEEIGWESWSKRLFKFAFMAPIFMFFLYFIFLLIQSNIFSKTLKFGELAQNVLANDQAIVIKTLLGVFMPMVLIVMLLLKATDIAKKGAGRFGDFAVGAGKAIAGVAGGLALGAATGGTAMLARGTIGRVAANAAESNTLRSFAARNQFGKDLLRATSGVASSSFDVRNTGLGKSAVKAMGTNEGAAKFVGLGAKKGFKENREEAVKKQEEFANKMLDTSDKGKAEMSRGGMKHGKAWELRRQMMEGGMDQAAADSFYTDLKNNGIKTSDLSNVARHINASRRNTYADRHEKRSAGWASKAGVRRASNRIAANKIRKDVATQKQESSVANILEHLAHEMGGHGPAHPPTPPPPANPPAGGGDAGHGPAH